MRGEFTARDLAGWARGQVRFELHADADDIAAVLRGQQGLLAARDRGAVYGQTTGVGALRSEAIAADEVGSEAALRLWRSHAGGLGQELDDETARATMGVRWRQFLSGNSGVSPELLEGLERAIDAGCVPRLHAYGPIGSGDLTVLSELALHLVGELPWRSCRGQVPPPVTPVASDALPFISSNAMTLALGSLASTRLSGLASVALQVAALSHLGLRGSVQPYDARIYAGGRRGSASAVAAVLRELLPAEAVRPDRLQDPFSLRCLPQVHAPLHDALTAMAEALDEEINDGVENPLVVGDDVLHHGQFLTSRIAAGLDAVRASAYPVVALIGSRVSALQDSRLTGLSPFLAQGPAGSSGLMIVEYVATDLLARIRPLVAPTSVGHAVVSLGIEEHASFSSQGGWSTQDLADLMTDLIACELVTAVRALELDASRLPDSPLRTLFDTARARWEHQPEDHVLGPELKAASDLVAELAAAVPVEGVTGNEAMTWPSPERGIGTGRAVSE